MASERQIAANRRNAAKSTGPRSPAGKTRAARNAVKHGLASSSTSDIDSHRLAPALIAERDDRSAMEVMAAGAADAALARARGVQMKASAELLETFEKRYAEGSILEALEKLQKIDRYVRRATSRKKSAFRELSKTK